MHDVLSIEIWILFKIARSSIIFKAAFPSFSNMECDEPHVTKRNSSAYAINKQLASWYIDNKVLSKAIHKNDLDMNLEGNP